LKKFRIWFIIGFLLLIGVGIFTLKQNHDYEASAAEISSLLSEARTKGFPTSGEEFGRKIPDSENAWIEIGPILMKRKDGKADKYAYVNEYASNLLSNGKPSDQKLIQEALDLNRADRETILAVLKSKKSLVIPRNYNEGYTMLYPDLARLKTLTNDLCLDALSHAMTKDSRGTLECLEATYILGSELMSQKDELSRLIAQSIFSIISHADLRIIEVDPSLTGMITDQAKAWAPKFEKDPFDTFEWYFLEQMATCRNFDEPVMDRMYPGFPFDKILKAPDPEVVDKDARIQPGNSIPKSPAMRRYMLSLLHQWSPVIKEIKDPATKRNSKTADSIADRVDWATDCPRPLKDLLTELLEGSVSVSGQMKFKSKIDLLFEAFRQVEYKQSHGNYADHILGSIRIDDPTEKFTVTRRGNGIQVGSGYVSDDGLAETRICIPLSAGFMSKPKEPTTMTKLRNGTLKVSGAKN
jgi:hypothetical protein